MRRSRAAAPSASHPRASHHLGPVPVGGLHQRDHQLPGEVPTEDEQVGVVEPGGGDELPPAKLRAVEVGWRRRG